MADLETQLRKRVKVRRLYEVDCDFGTCNGMQDELVDSLREAEEAREQHIKLHLQGALSTEDTDDYTLKEGAMGRWG